MVRYRLIQREGVEREGFIWDGQKHTFLAHLSDEEIEACQPRFANGYCVVVTQNKQSFIYADDIVQIRHRSSGIEVWGLRPWVFQEDYKFGEEIPFDPV